MDFLDQRKVHSFELPEDIFLSRPGIEPRIVAVTESIQGREQPVTISHELVFLDKPASNTTRSLVIIRNQGTCFVETLVVIETGR